MTDAFDVVGQFLNEIVEPSEQNWDNVRDGVAYTECDTEYQAGELPIRISRSIRVF